MQDPTDQSPDFGAIFKSINHALCILDEDLEPLLATYLFYQTVDQLPSKKLTLENLLLDSIRSLISTSSRYQYSAIEQCPLRTEIVISNKSFETKNYILTLLPFTTKIPPSNILNQPRYLIELIPINPILITANSFNSYKAIVSKMTHELFDTNNKAPSAKHTNLAEAVTAAINYYDNLLPSDLDFANRITESLLLDCNNSRIQELLFRIILEAIDFTSAVGNIVFTLNDNLPRSSDRVEIYTFITRNNTFQRNTETSMRLFIDRVCSYRAKVFQSESLGANYTSKENKLTEVYLKDRSAITPGSFDVAGFDTWSLNLKELKRLIISTNEAMHIQMVRSDLLVIRFSVPLVDPIRA